MTPLRRTHTPYDAFAATSASQRVASPAVGREPRRPPLPWRACSLYAEGGRAVFVRALGGAMARVAPAATAFEVKRAWDPGNGSRRNVDVAS